MLRALIRGQVRLSRSFDRLLPPKFRLDGNSDFLNDLAPRYMEPELAIYGRRRR